MSRKLPSFPFYPGDWRKDADLSRCSHAAKGVWIDMLCVAFDCEQRGVFATAGVPWTVEEIAAAVGGDSTQTVSYIRELIGKGVVKVSAAGSLYSARQVRDEENRQKDAKRKSESRVLSLSGPCPVSVTPLSEDESERIERALPEEEKPPGGVRRGMGGEGVAERAGFRAFWEAYPVKIGELEAHRAWGALFPDAKLEAEIMAALEKQKHSKRWRNPDFILYPAKWLSGHHWLDRLTPETNGHSRSEEIGKILAAKGLKP